MASYAPPTPPPVSSPNMSMAPPDAPLRGVPYPGASDAAGSGSAPSGPALAAMPGSASRYQPTTRETKTTTKAGPFTGAMTDATLETLRSRGELAGARLGADAAQGEAGRQVEGITSAFDASQEIAQRLRHQHQASELQAYHDNIEALQRDAASERVDPGKWFADQSTPQKLLTMVGAAIAGFGYGYTGRGINPAEWINQRIQESVEAQRANVANKRASIGEARAGYQELREKFGDDERASLASEIAQRQFVIGDLQRKATDVTAPAMSRLRATQIAKDLAEDNQKTLEHLDDRTLSSIEQSGGEKFVAGGPGGVGVRVRLDDGSTRVIPAAQAKELGLIPKDAIEAEKARAETAKTKAETAALEKKNGGEGKPIDVAVSEGQKLGSTAFLSDPLAAIAQHFQGTDANKTALSRESINAVLMGEAHKQFGARTPEAQREIMKPFMIESGDRPERIREKVENFRRFLAGGHPYSAGAGAEEE